MTTKDWIYFGLIVLAALAFYWKGFYTGVCRSKRVYEQLLDDAQSAGERDADAVASGDKSLAEDGNDFATQFVNREDRPLQRGEMRGDFGNN